MTKPTVTIENADIPTRDEQSKKNARYQRIVTCRRCGGDHWSDRSCDCFDNHCQ